MRTTIMLKVLKRATLAAMTLGALALDPLGALAGNQVPLRATWAAQISLTPLTPPFVAISGLGAGQATHLGQMTTQSLAEVVDLATGEGAASYRFTAANGDEILLDFVFVAIPTGPTVFAVQGVWQITGGTGRFVGALGSGSYVGEVEFIGPVDALGRFELGGVISSPGSLN